MSFSYPTKWLIYLSLFEQGRQSPRKFRTQEEAQTWTTPCSSKAHRGIIWFSSQPFNVPRRQGPVGQLFPSQQMKKALIPTLFNSVKGFLAHSGRHWHYYCGMTDHSGPSHHNQKRKSLKGQMSCNALSSLSRETYCSAQREQWDGSLCRAHIIHINNGRGTANHQWHGSAKRLQKSLNLL